MTSAMLKALRNLNDRTKNKNLVNLMESGLSDFKNEIENMSEIENKLKNHIKH